MVGVIEDKVFRHQLLGTYDSVHQQDFTPAPAAFEFLNRRNSDQFRCYITSRRKLADVYVISQTLTDQRYLPALIVQAGKRRGVNRIIPLLHQRSEEICRFTVPRRTGAPVWLSPAHSI